jgi:hypothetical protein
MQIREEHEDKRWHLWLCRFCIVGIVATRQYYAVVSMAAAPGYMG